MRILLFLSCGTFFSNAVRCLFEPSAPLAQSPVSGPCHVPKPQARQWGSTAQIGHDRPTLVVLGGSVAARAALAISGLWLRHNELLPVAYVHVVFGDVDAGGAEFQQFDLFGVLAGAENDTER